MASIDEPRRDRARVSRRRLVAATVAAVGLALGAGVLFLDGGGESQRPALQRTLDALVAGPQRSAPGATAYVVGPGGSWSGAAGVANVRTRERMAPDARLRIESNSKTWLTAVVLQLAKEHRLQLDDTVERWLPGLLPYGNRVTLRQLMSDTSGLVDDFDGMFGSRSAFDRALANTADPELRARWLRFAARLQEDPGTRIDPIWVIRLAARQPLLFEPGSRYHHSNVGWKIAGLIAAKAAGKPLGVLYRQRIFEPLRLEHTAYQPQGPIAGPHAVSYAIAAGGGLTEHAYPFGMGADGGIVTDAADEATFVRALVGGELGVRPQLLDFWHAGGSDGPGCPGDAFLGVGANDGGWSYAYSDRAGKRAAVLLLNGARAETVASGDPRVAAAARRLFCAPGL